MTQLADTGQNRIYAVHFSETGEHSLEPDKAIELLEKEYPHHYQLAERLYLVRTTHLADVVARNVGIKAEPNIALGAVFKLNQSYSGYYKRTLWDWLGDD